MINAMMIQLYQPLNFMGMVYREIKQALIDIETMFAILEREPEIEDKPDAKPLVVGDGAIRFENVAFAYEPERPILKGLSFEVPAGQTVAIVGPSGAGKSTISRLLFRFYDVTGGRILIDGQDIRDVTQTSLRAAIGMVPQDTVLFNDTIRYNIRYGRWEATDAEVEEAARLAQIDGFIRMSPQGLRDRGRRARAEALRRREAARRDRPHHPQGAADPVLDEATSALDSHTEKEIQDALDRVSRNRTTLVIAHRLSTIVGADEIIVLDQGVIVERGTHHELLRQGRALRQHVEPPARGGGGAREARAGRRRARPRRTATRRRSRTPLPMQPSRSRRSRRPTRRSNSMSDSSTSIRSQLAPIHREGLSVHRRLCAGEPDPVLAVDAARLARHRWRRCGAPISSAIRARVTPVREGLVVAPADGRVSRIANAVPPPELGLGERPLPRVSIFMSVFDCHVNRSPVTGRIERIVYRAGNFLNADLDKASEDNERNCLRHRDRRASHRRGADRRPGRAPHRLLRARGRRPSAPASASA